MDAKAWFIISIVGYSLAGVLFIMTAILFFKMRILAIIGDLSGRTAAKQIQEIREQNVLTGNKRHKPSMFNLGRGSLTDHVGDQTGKRGLTGTGQAVKSKRLGAKGQTGMELEANSSRLNEQNLTILNKTDAAPKEELLQQKVSSVVPERQSHTLFNEETDVLRPIHESTNDTDIQASETEVLTDYETEVLADSETEVLSESWENHHRGTEVLQDGTEVLEDGSTEVLDMGTEVLNDDLGTTVLHATGELEPEDEPQKEAVDFRIVKDVKIIHTNEMI